MDHSCLLGKSPSRRKKSKKCFFFLGRSFRRPRLRWRLFPFPRNSFRQIFFRKKKKIGSPRLSSPSFPGREKNLGTREMAPNDFFSELEEGYLVARLCRPPSLQGNGAKVFFKKKIWGKPLRVTRVRYVHPASNHPISRKDVM